MSSMAIPQLSAPTLLSKPRAVKRITSKRASNWAWQGGTVLPGGSTVVPDELVALLEPGEWDIEEASDSSPPDTAPEVQTRPVKKARTRK